MSEKELHVLFIHPQIRTNEPPNHPPYGILELLALTDQLGYKTGLIDNNAFRFSIDALKQELRGNPQPKSFRYANMDIQVNPNGNFQTNASKWLDNTPRINMEEFGKKLAEETKRISLRETYWDVIGIGGLTTQTKYIIDIAKMCREEYPDSVIVGGGGFISAQPFDMMKWIPELDIGVIGEAYNTWPEVLDQCKSGRNWPKVKGLVYREGKKIKLSGVRPLISEKEMDDVIPWPAYEFSPVEVYLKYSAIPYSPESAGLLPLNLQEGLRRLDARTSLGCTWNCAFCFHMGSTPGCQAKIYGKKVTGQAFRQHSPEYVVNLIDDLRRRYGVNFISFIDENFATNKTWFYDFCAQLEQQDLAGLIHWGMVGHSRTVDREMLTKGRDVGLSYISYGGETGSARLLKQIGKGQTPEQMSAALEATQAAQVTPIMSFILGFPGETIDDVIETCQFFIDHQIHCDPFLLQPYPGTAYYEEYKDKIIEQHLTPEEQAFILYPNVTTWRNLPGNLLSPLPSDSKLNELTPQIIGNIRNEALKRWVLSLDDATKMSCNLTDFTDVELAGLKYLLFTWDIKRLKQLKQKQR